MRDEIRQVIDDVFARECQGRASSPQIVAAVWPLLTAVQREYLAYKGLMTEVSSYFRAKRPDGLPQAPEANSEGVHAQLELFTVDEFRHLIAGYMSRSHADRRQAQNAADRCMAIYGVPIDIENPFTEAAA